MLFDWAGACEHVDSHEYRRRICTKMENFRKYSPTWWGRLRNAGSD
jgi:hypothetical protein